MLTLILDFIIAKQVTKVRSPIPWVYGVFYTMYYWMILTAIL
jgi:hypothetical protein